MWRAEAVESLARFVVDAEVDRRGHGTSDVVLWGTWRGRGKRE